MKKKGKNTKKNIVKPEDTKILNKKTQRIKNRKIETKNIVKNDKKEDNILNITNPKNIEFFKNIIEHKIDPYNPGQHSFCAFKSIVENIFYLIYTNQQNLITLYNLMEYKIISEIKNPHSYGVSELKYYSDTKNKRDLILSIYIVDLNIKVWNINKIEIIANITVKAQYSFSASLLNNQDQFYILVKSSTSNIQVLDFTGKQINEINEFPNDSDESISFLDTFYDNKLYIITGNYGYCKSYDYVGNKEYKKYEIKDCYSNIFKIIIVKGNIVKLIGASDVGYINIWNFHSAELLNIIKDNHDYSLENIRYGICLWNKEYLFLGSIKQDPRFLTTTRSRRSEDIHEGYSIDLLEINTGKIISKFYGHLKIAKNIQKIIHPQYGECLLSQDVDYIKLWVINK